MVISVQWLSVYFCRITFTALRKKEKKQNKTKNIILLGRSRPRTKRDALRKKGCVTSQWLICSWRGTLHKVLNSHRILTIHFIGFSTFLSKPSQKLHQMENDGKRRGEWRLFVVFHNKIVILVFPNLIRVHFYLVEHVTAIQVSQVNNEHETSFGSHKGTFNALGMENRGLNDWNTFSVQWLSIMWIVIQINNRSTT